jgi:hypothetical protein
MGTPVLQHKDYVSDEEDKVECNTIICSGGAHISVTQMFGRAVPT